MKLIVGRSENGPVFYDVAGPKIRKIEMKTFGEQELFPVNNDLVDATTLPRELVEIIIVELFTCMLTTFNFHLAFYVCQTDSKILKRIYSSIYGKADICRLDMLERISKTMQLLEALHDDYITVPNESELAVNIMLCVQPSLRYKPMYNPWEFRTEFDLHIQSSVPATAIIHGTLFGDTVYISGNEEDGIIDVERFQHPVFCFGLSAYTGELIASQRTILRSRMFIHFKRLLVYIYGPNTGVYFMVKPTGQEMNPFITSSDAYVSFQ